MNVPAAPDRAIELFYSYSHTDESLRDQLEKHLALLQRQGVIQQWHDRRIGADTEWAGQIDGHMNSAGVILLLVSADFLASDYCYDIEIRRALERHEAGEAKVIPVILRACDWSSAPFGKLQVLPKNAQPITSWSNQDEAFTDVASGIRQAVGIEVALRPDETQAPDDEPLGEGQAEPRKKLGQLKPSKTVTAILSRAQRLVREVAPNEPINSSFLILAMLEHGREAPEEPHVPTFLAGHVFPDHEQEFETCRKRYMETAARRSKRKDRTANGSEFLSPNLWAVFREAHRIGEQIGWDGVSASQVLAALLQYPEEQIRGGGVKRLMEMGLDLGELRADFRQLMITQTPPEDGDAWAKFLPNWTITNPPTIAHYNSDLTKGVDQLDIMRDVTAMANLIASRGLQPPLSIGLFGNWGSGKSFFIDRLQEVCEGIARDAEADAAYGQYYWTRIVHVRFNAWNYIDANLWASLVSHLFDQLGRWNLPKPNKFEAARRGAIAQLSLAKQAREEASTKVADAEHARNKAEKARDDRQKDIDQDRQELANVIKQDVWDAVKTEALSANEDLKQHFERMGIAATEMEASKRQVYEHLREMMTLAGRTRAVWVTLTSGTTLPGRIYWCVGAGILLVVAAAWTWWQPTFGWVVGLMSELAVAVGAVATWVKFGADQVANVMKPVRDMFGRIDATLKKAELAKASEIARLENQLQQRQAEYEIALREYDVADRAVTEAQAELNIVHTGRLISRFIEQRVASGEYRKQLGIVATIRDDFNELDQLISGYNDFLRNPNPLIMEGDAQSDAVEANEKAKQLGINRIVLYIDDLDRCSPDRVVEVLQAIHLLLAFPLFVVVVAVDARWVSYALQDQYPHLLVDPFQPKGQNGDPSKTETEQAHPENGAGAVGTASTRDYLEKIFQIPFWIPPMDPDGSQRLIEHLVAADGSTTTDRVKRRTQENADNEHDRQADGGETIGEPMEGKSQNDRQTVDAGQEPAKQTGVGDPARVAPQTGTVKTDRESEIKRTKPSPTNLRISEIELAAMKELATLIGRSPRETKRFVNIYRLLKSAFPAERMPGFIGTAQRRGSFQHPMLLLAIVSGAPRIARAVLQHISANTQDADDVQGIGRRKRPRRQVESTFKDLITDMEADLTSVEQVAQLHRLTALMAAEESWSQLPVDELRKWVGRVAQFTFEPNA